MGVSITPQTVLRRKPDALAADVSGETVLMSVERGNYYHFNGAGSDIWRRIERPISVEALCLQLAAEYSADVDTIRQDVVRLLQQLAAEHLLDVVG